MALAPEPWSAERPRERLAAHGAGALASVELVALLLGTGTRAVAVEELARRVLAQAGGLPSLARASPAELGLLVGIGPARAARLAAAFELGRRAIAPQEIGAAAVGPAELAARVRARLAGLAQEVFLVVALDARLRVLEEIEIARGALDGVAVHPREVFRPLVRRGAAAAVLIHNHPSGDPTPSEDDLQVTRRLRAVGELLGIPIVDHLVVADGRWASIAELEGTLGGPGD